MFNEANLISKQESLLSIIPLFDIELTTRCNKVCSICPREKLSRNKEDMTLETFKALVHWLPSPCHVMFAGFGEPLLNKKIFDYIKLLKAEKPYCTLSIYTNGINLDRITIQKLFYHGLDLIQFSIADRNGISLAQQAFEICREYGLSGRIRFNIIYKDEQEKKDIQAKLRQEHFLENANISFKKMHNRGGTLYDFRYEGLIKTCGTFFMDTFISSNGNIHICSNDINGTNILGDIFHMDYSSLVNKKHFFLGNKEVATICRKCSDEYRTLHFNEV